MPRSLVSEIEIRVLHPQIALTKPRRSRTCAPAATVLVLRIAWPRHWVQS